MKTIRLNRPFVAFLHDTLMAAASFVAALALRLGDGAWPYLTESLLPALGLFTGVCAAVFWFTGLYRGIWRYASLPDLLAIARAVTLALLVFLPITFLVTRLEGLPRSFLIIDWFVLIFLLGGPRLLYRVFKDRGLDHVFERHSQVRVPVLLIGAGDAAELFIRETARDRSAAYEVVGVVDEKSGRVGRRMQGVPVLGELGELSDVIGRLHERGRAPQRMIVTRPLERRQMAELLDLAEDRGMSLARLPRLTEFKQHAEVDFGDDRRRPLDLRPIAIEDLLRRPQASLDRAAMRRLIEGQRILVTGAGGSIGSELVRQVCRYRPAAVTLLDGAEGLLYAIDREVAERHPDLERRAVLGDVRDGPGLARLFAAERPRLVFHAAALKHVPLVEANPTAAVTTNAVGTRRVADACRAAGVTAMVQVSTDKAVNPVNVMGAAKRLAECYCQALDVSARAPDPSRAGPRFVTVRFGNVLGSIGSVVPLFQSQLATGGPLTVTHPEMTRYFMTIREAVQLVLQASALGIQGAEAEQVGKIFVLDMGEPVRVDDLARQIVRLAGLRPDRDIPIVYTGVRPGEKLREELFHVDEARLPTSHPALQLAAARPVDLDLLVRGLDELEDLAARGREADMLEILQRLVPEYRSTEAAADRGAAAAS